MTAKKIKIIITRVSDGKSVEIFVDDEEGTVYQWTDGNFSCDCNRHLFFERALGNDSEWNSCPCGEEKYKVKLLKGKKQHNEIKGDGK